MNTLADLNEKLIKLVDLKGNIVLVDPAHIVMIECVDHASSSQPLLHCLRITLLTGHVITVEFVEADLPKA